MSAIPRVLRALVTRSPRDLAERASQIVRARLEAAGIGESVGSSEQLLRELRKIGIKGPEDLLTRFRARVEGSSLSAFRDRAATVACLRGQWPELTHRTELLAQQIADGRFDLLGHEGLEFGHPIDWAFDPVHRRRAPDLHWSRVPYLDPDVVGDHKVVWELNRHQYFVRLGQAAWLSADDRWTETFFEHLTGWMSANPPKRGINWTSSLETAFRAISWLWALHFFARAPQLSPRRFAEIVAQLRIHGRHVERYISTSFSPNTHLTGEALGLFYLGTMLPELPEADRWRRRGQAWLMGALEFQIRPDGGYFEQSIHYHRYTADFYVHLLLLSRLSGEDVPEGLEKRLESIIDHLVGVMRADGTTPLIGDDDGGRLLFLDDRRVDDVRSTILAGAMLLDRFDWVPVAGPPSEELVWLLGPDALDRFKGLELEKARRASRSQPDTGFYIMRSGTETREDFVLVRCGPHGALSGGHAHADALAIDLSICGRPLLVDPGTGSYTDRERRRWFRSSSAHNTVTLGGKSSSQSSGPFAWSTRASSTARQWVSLPPLDFLEGAHDGFERFGPGLIHERRVLYIRDGYWIVKDRIPGAAKLGPMRAHFQFAHGLSVAAEGEKTLRVTGSEGGQIATLTSLGPSTWEEREGWVSPVYGRISAAPAWASRSVAPSQPSGDLELVTLVTRGEEGPARVECVGGSAWRIGHRDILVLGSQGSSAISVEEFGFESDFEWVWARRNQGDGWETVFALGGARLHLGRGPSLGLASRATALCVTNDGAGGDRTSWLEVEQSENSTEASQALAAWAEHI